MVHAGPTSSSASSRRPRVPRVVGGLAVVALAAAFVGSVLAARARPVARGPRVPGIVLLVVDTLRADALEADDESDGLPRTRAWAAGATRWRQAFAPSSWTGPSVASILTGLTPLRHGVLEVAARTRLARAVPTLATHLAGAGFVALAATGGGWVTPESGLGAGFRRFRTDFDLRDPAAVVAELAAEAGDAPFFFFLHTYAAHDPYGDHDAVVDGRCRAGAPGGAPAVAASLLAGDRSPATRQAFLRAMLGDPCERAAVTRAVGPLAATRFWLADCRPFLEGGWRDEPGGPDTVDALRRAYRGALAHVDARVAATLAAVDRLPAGTVVLVVGDHGEAFGEHGPLHHGRHVVPEMVHVPLLLRADAYPRGATLDVPVGLTDVLPTLLALAGVPVPSDLDGAPLPSDDDGAAGRPVPSVVAPGETPDDAADAHLRRVALRDARRAWRATYDPRTATWADEAEFARERDPGEARPGGALPAGAGAAAFEAARARLRAEVERSGRLAAPPGGGP